MRVDYSIGEVAPYINWIYFFHAWGSSSMPLTDRQQLQAEATERLTRHAGHYHTHAVFQLFDAYSDGDDIVVSSGEMKDEGEKRIPCGERSLLERIEREEIIVRPGAPKRRYAAVLRVFDWIPERLPQLADFRRED